MLTQDHCWCHLICLVLLFGSFLDVINGKSINSTALLNVHCFPCFCQTLDKVSDGPLLQIAQGIVSKYCLHHFTSHSMQQLWNANHLCGDVWWFYQTQYRMATQYFAGQALVAEHSLKLPNLFREQYLNKPPPCLVHLVGHNVFVQLPILLVFVIIPGRNVCFGKVGAPVFHYISHHHCWLQKQVSAQVTFLRYLVQQ